MGQTTQTKNIDTATIAGMAARLEAALARAGAPVPPSLENKLTGLAAALQRFSDNRGLWTELPGLYEPRRVLQSHLAFTLFVPAGRADKARQAVDLLGVRGLLPHYGPMTTASKQALFETIKPLVRFPQQKADRLVLALTRWDDVIVCGVKAIMIDDVMTRHALVKLTIRGFGDKAAAHFMRNTGLVRAWDAMPIIDVHIKKLLVGLNMAIALEPRYAEWAAQFLTLSRMLGIPPLLLDAITWQAYANNYDITHSDFDNFNKDNNANTDTSVRNDPEPAHSQGSQGSPEADDGITTATYGIRGSIHALVAAGSGYGTTSPRA